MLRSLRLRITPFSAVNDPLELAPRMREDFPIEDARAGVSDRGTLEPIYRKFVGSGLFNGSYEKFIEKAGPHLPDLAAQQVELYRSTLADEFRNDHMAVVGQEFGLVCLSETFDDLLMWGHYTDCHRGFVVGFNTRSEFFLEPPLREVDYCEERVLMGHRRDHRNPPWQELILSLTNRKSDQWKYEKEWRQLRDLSRCVKSTDPNNPERTLYHLPIESEAISCLIFGLKCDAEPFRDFRADSRFSHVAFKKIVPHRSEFKLELVDA